MTLTSDNQRFVVESQLAQAEAERFQLTVAEARLDANIAVLQKMLDDLPAASGEYKPPTVNLTARQRPERPDRPQRP